MTDQSRNLNPHAASTGGVRERLIELHGGIARTAMLSRHVEASHMVAWCHELMAILAALPEGELIDLGERKWCEEDFEGEMNYAPLRGVPGPGTYRVFLQRKEVG